MLAGAASSSSDSFRDLIGIPFVSKGRDPKTGLDCYGLLYLVFERMGIHVDRDIMVDALDCAKVAAIVAVKTGDRSKWKPVTIPDRGVLVVLDMDPYLPLMPQHVGVCISKTRFIHTLQKTGSIITPIAHPFFYKRIRGYYQWASA